MEKKQLKKENKGPSKSNGGNNKESLRSRGRTMTRGAGKKKGKKENLILSKKKAIREKNDQLGIFKVEGGQGSGFLS